MKKHVLIVSTLAVTLLLASCGDMTQSVETTVTPTVETSPEVNWEVIDELNLKEIQKMYPKEYELYGRQGILDLGNSACNSVDYGMTVDGLAELSLDYGVDAGLLGAIFGLWIPTYCPDNEARFLNEPQSTVDTQQGA